MVNTFLRQQPISLISRTPAQWCREDSHCSNHCALSKTASSPAQSYPLTHFSDIRLKCIYYPCNRTSHISVYLMKLAGCSSQCESWGILKSRNIGDNWPWPLSLMRNTESTVQWVSRNFKFSQGIKIKVTLWLQAIVLFAVVVCCLVELFCFVILACQSCLMKVASSCVIETRVVSPKCLELQQFIKMHLGNWGSWHVTNGIGYRGALSFWQTRNLALGIFGFLSFFFLFLGMVYISFPMSPNWLGTPFAILEHPSAHHSPRPPPVTLFCIVAALLLSMVRTQSSPLKRCVCIINLPTNTKILSITVTSRGL